MRSEFIAIAALLAACGGETVGAGELNPPKPPPKEPDEPAPLCAETHDFADISVTTLLLEGPVSTPYYENYELSTGGIASAVSPTEFLLETCPVGDVDCASWAAYQVDVSVPGLDLARILPDQTDVDLTFVHECDPVAGMGCTSTLIVRSSLKGVPPPADLPAGLYLAVNDGDGSLPRNDFYSVEPVERHCRNFADTAACSSEGAGIYALQFRFTGGAEPVTVDMGETVTAPLSLGEVNVRNLRSYRSGRCDDDYNWAHVITGVRR